MTSLIPDSHKDLLERPIIVAFGTIMPNGSIQITPVWCSYDGIHIIVNASAGRQKHRNIVANPNVTVMAFDSLNQFRYIEVRGIVEEITAEGGGESMNELALQYTGKPKRYGIEAPPRDVDERLLYKIKPIKVRTAN